MSFSSKIFLITLSYSSFLVSVFYFVCLMAGENGPNTQGDENFLSISLITVITKITLCIIIVIYIKIIMIINIINVMIIS